MKKIACQYAIVRFTPYPETDEFANIGVITLNPKVNQLEFKLVENRYKRLTDFFNHLDRNTCQKAIGELKKELKAVCQAINNNTLSAKDVFASYVKPTEAIISFSDPAAMMGESVHQINESLFARYVEHDFAKYPDYQTQMNNRVRTMLSEFALARPFKKAELSVGTLYKANFDFVQRKKQGNEPDKLLVPQHLDFSNPQSLIVTADKTIAKFNRLKQGKVLPSNVLIAVNRFTESENSEDAWKIVECDLEKFGDICLIDDSEYIRQFAEA